MKEDKIDRAKRTEEVQAIIDRMPTNFGIRITILIAFFLSFLLILGWVVKYPDIAIGQVSITAENVSIKLIANSSGRLWINHFSSKDPVHVDDCIAIIQNEARLADIVKVKQIITDFNINTFKATGLKIEFPQNVSLGELNEKYFSFISAYKQYVIFYKENLLVKQKEILKKMLAGEQNILQTSGERLTICMENLRLTGKLFSRDSLLFQEKVLSESDFDKSNISFLASKDNYHSQITNITTIQEQIQETSNKMQQNDIQQHEQQKQVEQDLLSTYVILTDNLKMWEQKYVFKAPIDGKVQFLSFLSNDQFIQQGDAVFTIVPTKKSPIGQMILPSSGAGKVKIGQEVIIKLEKYPYLEFGTIKGIVSSISLTTNSIKTDKGIIETYLIILTLPDELQTNYGAKLDFQFEIKGVGEIITKKRRLIDRLFDNLKYAHKQENSKG